MSCNTILKQKGHKLTPQRQMILSLIRSSRAHLTAEEIFNYIQSRIPGVNKSTIYRTLELLEELGCVFKSELSDRFIYHHAEEGHHHHLICRACGKSIDCDESLFSLVEKAVKGKYDFQVAVKHMIISGLCRDCSD
jgi:Fur family ferric uptake transcriptional regulator